MVTALVVGASRGLGASLVEEYSRTGNTVFATSRSQAPSPKAVLLI